MKTKQEMWMRADELGSPGGSLTAAFFIKKIRCFCLHSVKRHINKDEILTTDIQYYNTLFNKYKDFS